MSAGGWHLTLRQAPTLRADLRGLTPAVAGALSAEELARWPVAHGRETLALGDLFTLQAADEGLLRLEGDLSRVDHVGWGLDGGTLQVDGPVGHGAGGCMRAGTLLIAGHAGDQLACEMAGGWLQVGGDVGDFAASSLPGSLDGMRGGTLLIGGRAGTRLADRMRRGTVLVAGAVGDFAASRLVAGTVALGGPVGRHPGYGMRRGSLVFAAGLHDQAVPDTYCPAGADAPVAWALLSRDIARLAASLAPNASARFADLGRQTVRRHLGDRAVGGLGEWIVPC